MFISSDKKNLGRLQHLLTLLMMVAVLIISFIFKNPAQQSDGFWFKLIWVELLILLTFLFTTGYFSRVIHHEHLKEQGGAMPALGVAIYSYASLSILLIILSSILPDSHWLLKIHLICQVILFCAFAFIYVMINLALTGAQSGTISSADAVTPAMLQSKLEMVANQFKYAEEVEGQIILIDNIKSLCEVLRYNIPNHGRHLDSLEYQTFVLNVEQFCQQAQASRHQANSMVLLQNALTDLIISAKSLKRIRS